MIIAIIISVIVLIAYVAWLLNYFKKHPLKSFSSENKEINKIEEGTDIKTHFYKAVLGEKNQIYYLMKFEQFDEQKPGLKAGWNWPAFLGVGIWALYRKMYGWFFASLGVGFLSISLEKTGSSGLGTLLIFAFCIPFAIFANSLYHGNVKKKIAVSQLTIKDESKLFKYLQYKGGVHAWVIWVISLLPVIAIITTLVIYLLINHPSDSKKPDSLVGQKVDDFWTKDTDQHTRKSLEGSTTQTPLAQEEKTLEKTPALQVAPSPPPAQGDWVLWKKSNISPPLDWVIVSAFQKYEQCIERQKNDIIKIQKDWTGAKIKMLSSAMMTIDAGVMTYYYNSKCLPNTIHP